MATSKITGNATIQASDPQPATLPPGPGWRRGGRAYWSGRAGESVVLPFPAIIACGGGPGTSPGTGAILAAGDKATLLLRGGPYCLSEWVVERA